MEGERKNRGMEEGKRSKEKDEEKKGKKKEKEGAGLFVHACFPTQKKKKIIMA